MALDFQLYFGEDLISVVDLEHKGNNKLFEIVTPKGKYLLKEYSTIQKDRWDRGETEFRAISYLWGKGFRNVPQPLHFYERDNVGIYSFEEGNIKKDENANEKDVKIMADFLAKIHNLNNKDKIEFPFERTRCLCMSDYTQLIDARINTISEDFAGGKEEKNFWESVCIKSEEIKDSFKIKSSGLNGKLSLNKQVLTPGDFGFHNMLINGEKYTFLDFEYFGRDDPAKQVLDFIHHDKTKNLDRELKSLFLEEYMEKNLSPPCFGERLRLIDPLIGLNWVLIYLNPLSKQYQDHMKFSRGDSFNPEKIVKERIIKAKAKLNNLTFFTD